MRKTFALHLREELDFRSWRSIAAVVSVDTINCSYRLLLLL